MEKIKDIAKELFAEIENADTLLQVCETIALFRKEMEKHMHGFIKKNRDILPPELTDYLFRSF